MRILQLIDSLEAGGAEMMAVNYANGLHDRIVFSGLVATRKEGSLTSRLHPTVPYFFLNRKHTLDWKAVLKLRKICKENRIDVLHAHSSSFAIACMVKVVYPRVRIIWHDHDGMSEFLDKRKIGVIRLASRLFAGVVAVNQLLRDWDALHLKASEVIYLGNFSMPQKDIPAKTRLKGEVGKRIICLANLRPQKNHVMLVEVAREFSKKYPDWSFHLVGKDFQDAYAKEIRQLISKWQLEGSVFLYGSCPDTDAVIDQAEIAVLTSMSEGLPVALLDYGLHKKPVVATAVGEIPTVISHDTSGLLVPSADVPGFVLQLERLVLEPGLRNSLAQELFIAVSRQHAPESVMALYLSWLKKLLYGQEND